MNISLKLGHIFSLKSRKVLCLVPESTFAKTFSIILFFFSTADSAKYPDPESELDWTQVGENNPQFVNNPLTYRDGY